MEHVSSAAAGDDPRLLTRGPGASGAFRLDDTRALIQTAEWISAPVDDPAAFGAIAAACALSPIYARGGQPLTAIALVSAPAAESPEPALTSGEAKLKEAGCVLLGTHRSVAADLRLGYAVTGLADIEGLWSEGGACAGDVVILTKPLGTGIVAAAIRGGQAAPATVAAATRSMITLNRIPARNARRFGARACTTVAGHGLLGHLAHLAHASNVSIDVVTGALLPLPGVLDLLAAEAAREPVDVGGLSDDIEYAPSVSATARALLRDPQTSGGLLLVLPPDNADAFLADHPLARAVGHVRTRANALIRVA
jgi:selenide, water dikinase